MNKKLSAVLSSGLIMFGSLASNGWAACVIAKGKIENNATSGSTTLGVAALALGNMKLKCAISGVAQLPGGPNFLHTIVCDDDVAVGQPQSQITLATTFLAQPVPTGACAANNPFGPVSFTFREGSVPIPNTGRGVFAGANTLGQIIITGNYNCNGGINMKFEGQVCYPD